jgi:23S rRNA (cytidine1920-2'-O)/16S rRNA (cytidine1409-2'-O)-methyltransferase
MPIKTKGTLKLQAILDQFQIELNETVCADFGCNVGGFTQELLTRGAKEVFAIDTGYGALDWSLRQNSKVIVKERCNALYLDNLPKMDLIVIDMAWTKQEKSIPAALKHLRESGSIVSLLKPQYEAPAKKKGKAIIFTQEEAFSIACNVFKKQMPRQNYKKSLYSSPIQGGSKQKGSHEFWIVIQPKNNYDLKAIKSPIPVF